MVNRNLARKGPQKVWSGYRNLRVPLELLDDVHSYLERRKQEYLLIQEGALTDRQLDTPGTSTSHELVEMIREVIKEEMVNAPRRSSPKSPSVQKEKPNYLNKNLTAKEQILEYLKTRPNEAVATTEMQEILSLPSATARQAARELADETDTIEKIPGRPNKFKLTL